MYSLSGHLNHLLFADSCSCLKCAQIFGEPFEDKQAWADSKHFRVSAGCYLKQYGGSLKTINRTTIWLSNATPGHIPRENYNSKRHLQKKKKRHLHLNVHWSTILQQLGLGSNLNENLNREMDNENVVHKYNGILCSHKKEQSWVICRDGPQDCHIKWSKSEREKQISYINEQMWNLEKWYKWFYLQRRNRDTDIENKHVEPKGRR